MHQSRAVKSFCVPKLQHFAATYILFTKTYIAEDAYRLIRVRVNWLVSGFAKQKQTLHLFLWTRSGHVFLTAVRCWHRRMFWGGVCWSESGWRCRLMIGRRSCDNGALCFWRFGEFVRCNLFSYWSALARASFCLVIKQSNADLPLTSRQHTHTNSHACTDI